MDEALLGKTLERSRELGFLGPGPVAGHLSHARAMASVLEVPPGSFLDLGSGGGVPGLVLAREFPQARGVLLDSMDRRCAFLREAISALGIGDRIGVVQDRAERAGHDTGLRERFDAVFARSFGQAAVTAECGAAFSRVGGALVVSEPPGGRRNWQPGGLRELGLVVDEITANGPRAGEYSVVVLRKVATLDQRFPRRVGVPAKRPLWR